MHRVLVRLGLSRLREMDRPTGERARRARRYERAAPGELVHTDVKKLGRIRAGGGWWAHGRDSRQAVTSRNAFAYRHSRAYADAVAALSPGARREFIRPHCPWTNGKAERVNQTANDEWARAAVYGSSTERTAALAAWAHEYNHHRPHAALGGLPPISRVTNVPDCDT